MATRKKAVTAVEEQNQLPDGVVEQPSPGPALPIEDKRSSPRKQWLILGVAFVILVMVATGGYLAYRAYATPDDANDISSEQAAKETQALLERVGTLILLPADETPVIYEVNDPAILISQQPFFAGAAQGDKLIIYPNAVKAILYSPSKHVLINVGPITFNESSLPPQ